MSGRRLFLDSAFVQAWFNRNDQHHLRAVEWARVLDTAVEVWTTEAVLVETGNALSATNRTAAVDFIKGAYRTANVRVVQVDTALLREALNLYEQRADKEWGLTDCISFVVMAAQGLTEALSPDHHFTQAGFVALMTRDPTAAG
jgi:predicted nucleic acid-binding protein